MSGLSGNKTEWHPARDLRRDQIHDDCCPRCGGEDIDGEAPAMGDDSAMQKMHCFTCGVTWNNVYTFTAVFFGKDSDYGEDGVFVDVEYQR